MRRAFLISVAVVAFVTGCGGGGSEPSASGEWTRHDIRDSSASIALPEEWKVLEDFDPETISDFTKENEKFAPYVEPWSATTSSSSSPSTRTSRKPSRRT